MTDRIVIRITLLLAVSGCVIPVSYTERATPPLIGRVLRSNGTPAAGERIAITTGYDEKGCRHPNARTMTDASGRFDLPGTLKQVKWVMLVPAFERFTSSYTLCVSAGDTVPRPSFEGYSSLSESAPGDTVACLQWEWENRGRVTCSTPSQTVIVSGGRWTMDDASGDYRLILTEVGPLKGPDGTAMRPRLAVQWVEHSTSGAPDSVHATVLLPTGDRFRSLTSLKDPTLWNRGGGHWCLSIDSERWGFLDSRQEMLWFQLGPPGDVRPVGSCQARTPLNPELLP